MSELNSKVESISNHKELADFIRSLAIDFENNSDAWENITIDRYLDAMAAWVEDMDGYYKNTGEPFPTNINWKVIGQILIAATVYE